MNGLGMFAVGALAGVVAGAVLLRSSETRCCKALGQVVRSKLVEDYGQYGGSIFDVLNLDNVTVELLELTGKVDV